MQTLSQARKIQILFSKKAVHSFLDIRMFRMLLSFSLIVLSFERIGFHCHAFAQTPRDHIKPFVSSLPTFPSSFRRMPWLPKPKRQPILAIQRNGKIVLDGKSKTNQQALAEIKFHYRPEGASSPPRPLSPLLLVLDTKASIQSIWKPIRRLLLIGMPRRFGDHWPAKDAIGVQILVARQKSHLPKNKPTHPSTTTKQSRYSDLFVSNLVFGLSTHTNERDHLKRTLRKFVVRITTKGIWLSVNTPIAQGCNLLRQLKTSAEFRAYPHPTCPREDEVACVVRCLGKLKEIFPDQRRLFFYVEKRARRSTTIQQLITLSIHADEARYPEQIWLFSTTLPLLPRR